VAGPMTVSYIAFCGDSLQSPSSGPATFTAIAVPAPGTTPGAAG
jgi:hypothetical protein